MNTMITEFEVNGVRFRYDAMCDSIPYGHNIALSKKEVMAKYPTMKYIGSSYTTYFNGHKWNHEKLQHFFVHDAAKVKAFELREEIEAKQAELAAIEQGKEEARKAFARKLKKWLNKMSASNKVKISDLRQFYLQIGIQ